MDNKIYNETFLCNFLIKLPDILDETKLKKYGFSPMKENNPDLESDSKLYEVKLDDIDKGIGQSIRYQNGFDKEIVLIGFFNKEIECDIKIINLNNNIKFWKYYSKFLESKINDIWSINDTIKDVSSIKGVTKQKNYTIKNLNILENLFDEKRVWIYNEMIKDFFNLGGLGLPRFYMNKLNLEKYGRYIIKDITDEDIEKLKYVPGRPKKPYNKERVLKLIESNDYKNVTELYRKITRSESVSMKTAIDIYKEVKPEEL